MSEPDVRVHDARAMAQDRLFDALLRALALEQPTLLERVRAILIDTEFTHAGKPGEDQTVHEQIHSRISAAERFAEEHGGTGRPRR